MRLTEFAYGLIERFAPMSEKSAIELRTDAMNWYAKTENEKKNIDELKAKHDYIMKAQDDPKLSDEEKLQLLDSLPELPKEGIQHKLVAMSESWIARTLFAILFIWITPKIQEYINPKKNEETQ